MFGHAGHGSGWQEQPSHEGESGGGHKKAWLAMGWKSLCLLGMVMAGSQLRV